MANDAWALACAWQESQDRSEPCDGMRLQALVIQGNNRFYRHFVRAFLVPLVAMEEPTLSGRWFPGAESHHLAWFTSLSVFLRIVPRIKVCPG